MTELWFEELKKKKKASPYSNPDLRAKIVARVKARRIGDGVGANGEGGWSGNKAMIAAKEYKEEGGGFK
tara:strand:- start:319 stop:525 length:207 start_codon:yes stop_codon:yes gene_type:complete